MTVDGSSTPATGKTGTDGSTKISLSPSQYGSNGNWTFGWHNLKVSLSIFNGGDVMTVDTWAGFDVRGLDMQIRPNKQSYTKSDAVMLDAFGPSSYTISSVKVDGVGVSSNITSGGTPGYNQINLSSGWKAGHHNVEVKISTGQGDQTFYTGFDILTYSIFVTTDKFSYNLYENVTFNITMTYPQNGSAVSGIPIGVSLFKAQPPNDIFVNSTSGTTGTSGKLRLGINATQPGFNYLLVNITTENQPFFIGLQVSSINITLQNSTGGALTNNEYVGIADGSTPVAIRVSATSGGVAITDGSEVSASIWAFGKQQQLPSNTTTGGIGTISFTIPAEAPAQTYGLEVRVITPSGDTGVAPPVTLRVYGGSALQIVASSDRSFMQPYMQSELATFTATLTTSNGTPMSGRIVNFVYGSEGSIPNAVGSAITGSDGVATLKTTAPAKDGPYYLLASVNNTNIQAYSGFLVSSLNVKIAPNATRYAPGSVVDFNITVMNRSSGAFVNATGGFISVFNNAKGKRDITFNPSGSQPYRANISIPNEDSAVGSYPISAVVFSNGFQGSGFTLIDVVNATRQINISVPASIFANSSFVFNISATNGSSAKVAVFSPSASSLVYDNSTTVLSGTPPSASISLTLDYPGIYVINAFVDGVGSTTKVVSVLPPQNGFGISPQVWTHTAFSSSSATNTTSFNGAVYVMANIPNATATIMRVMSDTNTTISTSLPLKVSSGTTYYNILNSTELSSGLAYFVRLDTNKASGVAISMFTVK